VKALLIIIAALILFGGLIMLKMHLAADEKKNVETGKIADIPSLENRIKSDSLYIVKDILYKDSGILIALDNPGKSGAESYFDKKFKLNDYSNINMVYIYQYDTTKPLQQVSLDDAIMAKGKKMAGFQEIWVAKFIDTTDGSCKPLKKYLQSTTKNSDIFQIQETSYQPESIHKMRVECKFKITDSLGKKTDNDITASVDTAGLVTLVDKPQ
jgi:oligogalacturonate-specific porin protein KdgM